MEKTQFDIYQEFSQNIGYPMVIFEGESGKVLEMNYDAEILLGTKAEIIRMEPGRALTKEDFWEMLHGRKSMIWHRIRLMADDREVLVSGFIHEEIVDGTLIYCLMFERRSDLNIGSVTLERIVNHANIVAICLCKEGELFKVDYVSQNINRYGFTRAQLYEEMVTLDEMICAEDVDGVKNHMMESLSKRMDDSVTECRLLSEQRELIPVRLLVHYVYNEYGKIAALEILVVDLSEELRKNRETNYLHGAISKMKSVVLVKSYKQGQRKLKYISPNAGMVGMNVEALTKGYKLTEDYIHPEDRDGVIDSIYQAVDSGITDYVQEYRMVRDDGHRIWVENVVTVDRISDGEAEISFLLTDITERKELEQELAATVEPVNDEAVGYGIFSKDNSQMVEQFQVMAEAVGGNADYYSVLLDLSGEQLINPVGPSKDMGVFYDLFERPEFKEKFPEVSGRVQTEKIPQSTSFSMDSLKINMVVVPVTLGTSIMAYWVMTCFGENGGEKLRDHVELQWKLSAFLAKCFYADELVENENHKRRLVEMQLHKEQSERNVMEELIGCMSESGVAGIGEVCHKAGAYLNVSDIGIYRENKKTGEIEPYYEWNQTGDDTAFFERMTASASEYQSIKQYFEEKGSLIVDRHSADGFLKGLMSRTGMGAIMLMDLKIDGESKGYVMIADKDVNRDFDKSMIRFTKMLTDLFGRIITGDEKGTKLEVLHEGFLDAYNHIRDAVFVKDNRSGDIIFANKAAEKLFGYSLEGRQATEIISDQLAQYRAIQGVRRRLIADKKITKWQSYMKELDQIMNIVEVHLDTISGADCSLVILKKSKNKDKKKD